MLNRSFIEMTQQIALQKRMEAIGHNIANMNTTGFKNRGVTFKEHLNQKPGIEGLSFVEQKGVSYDFTQGNVEVTHNPLDCAISGPGFFTVETPNGRVYTRNGQFKLNGQGQLTTMKGDLIVDNGGAPIAIPAQAQNIRITSEGDVQADGATLSRLGVGEFTDLSQLKEMGDGFFQSPNPPQLGINSKVIQSAIEKSNVSPIQELTQMIDVHRAYERAHNSQRQEEQRMEKTIDTIGRTA
jgi:flagellar basal-body rod protein FlgF